MGLTKPGVMISRHLSRGSQHWRLGCRHCRLRRSWSANLRPWHFLPSTSPFCGGSRRFNVELEKERWRSVECDINKGRKRRQVCLHVALCFNQDLMSPPPTPYKKVESKKACSKGSKGGKPPFEKNRHHGMHVNPHFEKPQTKPARAWSKGGLGM